MWYYEVLIIFPPRVNSHGVFLLSVNEIRGRKYRLQGRQGIPLFSFPTFRTVDGVS